LRFSKGSLSWVLAILWSPLFSPFLSGVEGGQPARVKAQLLPVYADTAATSGIVKFLRKGDSVEVLAQTDVGDNRWCSVKETGQSTMVGFVNCSALQFAEPPKKEARVEEKKVVPPSPPIDRSPPPSKPTRPPPPDRNMGAPPFGGFLQALWREDLPAVRDYLKRGVNPNQSTLDGTKPLLIAAKKRNPELLKPLIENGAEVDGRDENGLTALMWAASMGLEDNVGILIQAGANINGKDNSGLTPLMWATIQGHPRVVEILLARGAEVKMKNLKGLTAERLSQLIIADLKRSLADAEKTKSKAQTTKLKASLSRHEAVLQLLEAAVSR